MSVEINQEYLKTLLHYDEATGIFTWRVDYRKKLAGSLAGRISPIHKYLLISIGRRYYMAHRLAWLYMHGHWPKGKIDHINRIRDDNRAENLREVTDEENAINRSMHSNNKSGVTGVLFWKDRNAWKVNIKNIYIGTYKNFDDAVKARREAEEIYFR